MTVEFSAAAPARLVLATRASRLALWQAQSVQQALQRCYPACDISLLPLSTRGDEILDRSLAKIGGKGLFIKTLEEALQEGRADLAVHSLKDVPASLDAAFTLSAILQRGDPFDAFVSSRYSAFAQLPPGARVGTSSLRRSAQLARVQPELQFLPLRGNLDTRLRKLDDGEFDAIILAAAGLMRLDAEARIVHRLPAVECLPAPGQGTLAIESLRDRPELVRWLAPLHHQPSALCARAERQVSLLLQGSCQIPLAVFAQLRNLELHVHARLIDPDNGELFEAQAQADPDHPEALGDEVARVLAAQGADRVIARLNASAPAE